MSSTPSYKDRDVRSAGCEGLRKKELEKVKSITAAAVALRTLAGESSPTGSLSEGGGNNTGEKKRKLPSPSTANRSAKLEISSLDNRSRGGKGAVVDHISDLYWDHDESDTTHTSTASSCKEFSHLTFPLKLMMLLSDPELRDIASWLPHGKSFFIMNPKMFSSQVLPRYFNKQAEYRSFTRRLLRWGFKRVSKGNETGAYYHEYFQRDKPHLATKIKTSHKPACENFNKSLEVKSKDLSLKIRDPSEQSFSKSSDQHVQKTEKIKASDSGSYGREDRVASGSVAKSVVISSAQVSNAVASGENTCATLIGSFSSAGRLASGTIANAVAFDEGTSALMDANISTSRVPFESRPQLPQHCAQNESIVDAAAAAAAGRAEPWQIELLRLNQHRQERPTKQSFTPSIAAAEMSRRQERQQLATYETLAHASRRHQPHVPHHFHNVPSFRVEGGLDTRKSLAAHAAYLFNLQVLQRHLGPHSYLTPTLNTDAVTDAVMVHRLSSLTNAASSFTNSSGSNSMCPLVSPIATSATVQAPLDTLDQRATRREKRGYTGTMNTLELSNTERVRSEYNLMTNTAAETSIASNGSQDFKKGCEANQSPLNQKSSHLDPKNRRGGSAA